MYKYRVDYKALDIYFNKITISALDPPVRGNLHCIDGQEVQHNQTELEKE
jgi:hypothetical protein